MGSLRLISHHLYVAAVRQESGLLPVRQRIRAAALARQAPPAELPLQLIDPSIVPVNRAWPLRRLRPVRSA